MDSQDYNYRWCIHEAYEAPLDYRVPDDNVLLLDTQHPETNAQAFNHKNLEYKRPTEYPPFYCSIAQNKNGLFVLAANNFNTYVYDGVITATYDFNNFSKSLDDAEFQIFHKDNSFNLQFLEDDIFVGTTTNAICLYNSKEPLRGGKIMSEVAKGHSDGRVSCLARLQDDHRFACGTTKGAIEGFDYTRSEMTTIFSLANAHSTEVKAISAHPFEQSQWVSCAGNEIYHFDRRCANPSVALLDKRSTQTTMTSLAWYNEHYIAVTDCNGDIMVIDSRQPNEIVFQKSINDDVDKIFMHKNMLGMVSRSLNKVQIFEINESQEELKLLHEETAPVQIYSMCWDKTEKKSSPTFYIVGAERYAKEINLAS